MCRALRLCWSESMASFDAVRRCDLQAERTGDTAVIHGTTELQRFVSLYVHTSTFYRDNLSAIENSDRRRRLGSPLSTPKPFLPSMATQASPLHSQTQIDPTSRHHKFRSHPPRQPCLALAGMYLALLDVRSSTYLHTGQSSVPRVVAHLSIEPGTNCAWPGPGPLEPGSLCTHSSCNYHKTANQS